MLNQQAFIDKINETLQRRADCVKRLKESFKEMSTERILTIITSFIEINELEEITKFQEEHNNAIH